MIDLTPPCRDIDVVILVRVLESKRGADVVLELLAVLAQIVKEADEFPSLVKLKLGSEGRAQRPNVLQVVTQMVGVLIRRSPVGDRSIDLRRVGAVAHEHLGNMVGAHGSPLAGSRSHPAAGG